MNRPFAPEIRNRLALFAGAAALACASAPPPPAPAPATNTVEPSPADPTAATEEDVAPPSQMPPPVEAPGPAPDASPALALCETLCERVRTECEPEALESCQGSCPGYESTWERCPVEVERALACQAQTSGGLLCANVATESCAPHFAALANCRTGRAAPLPRQGTEAAEATGETLPEGWERRDVPELGISVPLPRLATTEDGTGGKRVVASEGPIEYRVEGMRRLRGAPTDKALLKAVLDYVGPACQKGLRVHGRFETGEIVHVNFDTQCMDGLAWRGMLHVDPERQIATSLRSTAPLTSAEVQAKLDALAYGMRYPGR
jgi:hypothetical protein